MTRYDWSTGRWDMVGDGMLVRRPDGELCAVLAVTAWRDRLRVLVAGDGGTRTLTVRPGDRVRVELDRQTKAAAS